MVIECKRKRDKDAMGNIFGAGTNKYTLSSFQINEKKYIDLQNKNSITSIKRIEK